MEIIDKYSCEVLAATRTWIQTFPQGIQGQNLYRSTASHPFLSK